MSRLEPWKYKTVIHDYTKPFIYLFIRGNFDNCFGKFSHYSDVTKGMDCPKYLKQVLHGYNSAILSFGVG